MRASYLISCVRRAQDFSFSGPRNTFASLFSLYAHRSPPDFCLFNHGFFLREGFFPECGAISHCEFPLIPTFSPCWPTRASSSLFLRSKIHWPVKRFRSRPPAKRSLLRAIGLSPLLFSSRRPGLPLGFSLLVLLAFLALTSTKVRGFVSWDRATLKERQIFLTGGDGEALSFFPGQRNVKETLRFTFFFFEALFFLFPFL